MIIIDYNILQNGDVEYYVISGITTSYPLYQWYLNGNLVSDNTTYIRVNPQIGDKVFVKISENIVSCTNFAIEDCTMVGNLSLDCYDNSITECGLEGKIEDPLNRALWHDGHYYGGHFWGTFGGGTFHYGFKNGVQFSEKTIKPKNFIK
ncbi:MAG: hypothetical protein JXA99_01935 [Candidatus Lokiarchaeota archaeon]|nr:hypothetical protein [Candidatus Lokiarchaeota archaeon]